MVTRVVLDKKSNKVQVVNTFLAIEIDLQVNADLLGVSSDQDLLELVKKSGGVKKFKAVAEETFRQSSKRK